MIHNKENVVIIGNFDGYHLGHKKIIMTAKKIAELNEIGTVLITFDPNPKLYFRREKSLIFDCDQKDFYLKNAGIDIVKCINFIDVKDMKASDFVDKYLIEKYSMRYLVVGKNFRLGKNQEWGVDDLVIFGEKVGFNVKEVRSEFFDGEAISSTRVREALRKGELNIANGMLGRNYSVSGNVSSGDKIGTEIGFPTINIYNKQIMLPKGVYSTRTEIDGKKYKSATYIGTNPTLKSGDTRIETHILNFNKKIYGKKVNIYFIKLIRKEIKFKNRRELIRQIKSDVELIRVDNLNDF